MIETKLMPTKIFNSTEISSSEWYSINRFVSELHLQNNPCVSVYYPHDKISETINLLRETKRDIKTEKIESAIEKRITNLSKNINSKKLPFKTYCVFGWESKGKIILKNTAVSKKLPYIYLASKKPYLKPFYDILKSNYQIILVILDHKTAKIRLLQGDQVLSEQRLSINLQGRHKKGGQSQKRFLRARQTYIQGFFKKIAKKIDDLDSNNTDLLFLGGSGTAKIEFHDELDSELKKKCRFIQNISFSTSADVINKKIIKHLYDYRRKQVLEIVSKFQRLVKEGLITKKNSEIQKALEIGAVDTLLISANYYHSTPMSKKIIKIIEMAENTSSKIEFVTNLKLTRELEKYDHVVALLRYKFK